MFAEDRRWKEGPNGRKKEEIDGGERNTRANGNGNGLMAGWRHVAIRERWKGWGLKLDRGKQQRAFLRESDVRICELMRLGFALFDIF